MSAAGSGRPGTGGAVARVAIVGLGAIGQEVLKAVQARPGLRLVSVADPAFVGRDAGEVAGVGACGVIVVGGAAEAFAGGLDVALVLTGSSVSDVEPVIEAACRARRRRDLDLRGSRLRRSRRRRSSRAGSTRGRARPASPSSEPA